MKLILTNEVTGLGEPGDVVDVKPGYARNFLIPRGLATAWSKGAEKNIESIRRARHARTVHDLEGAQALKAKLEGKPVPVSAKAGAGGRLFGAVTTTDIAAAIKAAGGPDVDKRRIEVAQPIKSTGQHVASVRVHPEVVAQVTLDVVEA